MNNKHFISIGIVIFALIAIIIFSVSTTDKDFASTDKEIRIELSSLDIPLDAEQRIDYDQLVKKISKPQFEKLLTEKNVQFSSNDIVLLQGPTRSAYTEDGGLCGYVVAADGKEYWLKSYLDKDVLSEVRIMTENPDPCKPNHESCFCMAQTHLAENTKHELSYLTAPEEETMGKVMREYLEITPISNVSDRFVVGKYNIDSDFMIEPYCGQFIGEKRELYFEGYIQSSKVVDFGLAFEKPILCAINDDAQLFDFNQISD